jgi:O-acetyl-ADP-ribose deacetylase (regulator of RNase III)
MNSSRSAIIGIISFILTSPLLFCAEQRSVSLSAHNRAPKEVIQEIINKEVDLVYRVKTPDGKPAGEFILRYGDITQHPADAIVNAANESLLGGGGVDGAIHTAAGKYLRKFNETLPCVEQEVRCPLGHAAISPSFNLHKKGIKFIISTVGPRGSNPDRHNKIREAYTSCLSFVDFINQRVLKYSPEPGDNPDPNWGANINALNKSIDNPIDHPIVTIAFPLISAAIYGYNVEDSAPLALQAIIDFMQKYARSIHTTTAQKPLFKVILYFYGDNPDPAFALSIYMQHLEKTLDDQQAIAYPHKLIEKTSNNQQIPIPISQSSVAQKPKDPFSAPKILVCDFHGVLADTNYPKAIVKGLCYLPLIIPHALYRLFWEYSLVGHLWRQRSLNRYPWSAIIDTFAPAAACQTLRTGVFDELRRTKKEGKCSGIYLFSGITPGPLKRLQNQYPSELQFFDGIISVGPESGWINKKNEAFYTQCNNIVRKAHPHATIIFFDDKEANRNQGQAKGWRFALINSAQSCITAIKEHLG